MTAFALISAALWGLAGLAAAQAGWAEGQSRKGCGSVRGGRFAHAGSRGGVQADPDEAGLQDASVSEGIAGGPGARSGAEALPAWLAVLCVVVSCMLGFRAMVPASLGVAGSASVSGLAETAAWGCLPSAAPRVACLAGVLVVWAATLAAAVTDGISRQIPNRDVAIIAAGGTAVRMTVFGAGGLLRGAVAAGILACVLLALRAWRGRDSLGGGDVKMLAAACMLAGPELAGALVIVSFGFAAAFSLVGMAAGRLGRSSGFAFGPFIAAGVFAVLWRLCLA